MRPLSGSATLAILTDVIHRLGPDNIVSLMAATIYGSTETTFYVAAVYFGSVGVKQTRHAIPAGLSSGRGDRFGYHLPRRLVISHSSS